MREANAEARITSAMNDLFAQSAHRGALPVLAAATYSPLLGGSYIGPDGFMEMRGFPKLTRGSRSLASVLIGQVYRALSPSYAS